MHRLTSVSLKMHYSSLGGNYTNNNFDTGKAQLTRVSFGHGDAGKEPAITSITAAPNPSTKGDKVILNIMVADENSSSLTYLWSEFGNSVVSLNGADTTSPSFIAPHVKEDTNVTFCLTVTNEMGRTSYGNITATIQASNKAPRSMTRLLTVLFCHNLRVLRSNLFKFKAIETPNLRGPAN